MNGNGGDAKPGEASEIIAHWQEARRKGQSLSPEQLCVDHPGLFAEVQHHIAILKDMEQFLGMANPDSHERSTVQEVRGAGDDTPKTRDRKHGLTLPVIDGYDVQEELGRGGMGVVYKAWQVRLKRTVAIKTILAGEIAGQAELSRFLTEAEAIAKLQHPNIVQIHEIDETNGKPFFCMEFVSGGSLSQKIAGIPQPPNDCARIVEILARAMEVAHQSGIVHRDLKPGNILLTAAGIPKVADFGLAKKLDADALKSRSGSIVGTPSYMAPEQAAGRTHDVGPASDVYALGAILYDLLTGRPPFRAETAWDTIQQVVSVDPVAPSRLQPTIPPDLETICLKCLEKNPAKRYASSDALADDLRRFQAKEPIVARPVSHWERASKWIARHPVIAGLSAGLLTVTLLGISGIVWKWQDADFQRSEAVKAQELAEDNALKEKQAKTKVSDLAVALKSELLNSRRQLYITRVQFAHRAWYANEVQAALALLALCVPAPDEPDFRSWEWHYVHRLCHSEKATLAQSIVHAQSLAIDPTGKWIAAGSMAGTTHVWDAQTHQKVFDLQGPNDGNITSHVTFNKEGTLLAAALGSREWVPQGDDYDFRPGEIRIWNVASSELVRRIPHQGAVFAAAFSPDGKYVASSSVSTTKPNAVILWDWEKGAEVRRFKCKGAVHSLAFSPDGQHLASGCDDHIVRIWVVSTGNEVFSAKHPEIVRSVAFSPDGKNLASADLKTSARIWDVTTGKQLLLLPQAKRFVVYETQGRFLATGGANNATMVWDAHTGAEIVALRGTDGPSAFDPTGKTLASVGSDQSIKLWDIRPQEARMLRKPNDTLLGFCFSRDSRFLGIAGLKTRVWNIRADSPEWLPPKGGWASSSVSFASQDLVFVTLNETASGGNAGSLLV